MKARVSNWVGFSFVIIGLLTANFSTALASIDIDASPVNTFNLLEWNQKIVEFQKSSVGANLSEFIRTVHGGMVFNRWKLKDQENASKSWVSVRNELCPSKKYSAFCSLPEDISSGSSFGEAVNGLLTDEVLAEINFYFKEKGISIDVTRILAIPIRPQPPGSIPAPLDFVMSGRSGQDDLKSFTFWEDYAVELPVRELEYRIFDDIYSTYPIKTPRFFGIDVGGRIILFVDRIKKQSNYFASLWKLSMDIYGADDAFLDSPTASSIKHYRRVKLFKSYEDRFEPKYQELLAELKKMQKPGYKGLYKKERIQKTLDRFQKDYDPSRTIYPEEVFQHVAYEIFRETVTINGLYYGLMVQTERGIEISTSVSFENILMLQVHTDASLVLDAMALSIPFPDETVLDQLMVSDDAKRMVFEQLAVVLELDRYLNSGNFARFGYVFTEKNIITEEFLSNNAPEVVEADWYKSAGGIEGLSKLSSGEQREFLIALLFKADTNIRMNVFFKMVDEYTAFIEKEHAVEIGNLVFRTRFLPATTTGGQN